MAISYKEIKKLIRFKEQDNNELTFSDYEIRLAVNEVLRYLNMAFATLDGDFNEKGYVFDQEAMNKPDIYGYAPAEMVDFKIGGVELPEDFLSLVAVQNKRHGILEVCPSIQDPMAWQYKIVGNRIYCGSPWFKLLYKANINCKLAEDDDEVELPDIFIDVIVKQARMILHNSADTDATEQAVFDAVKALLPKRRYRNARIPMPFVIGR